MKQGWKPWRRNHAVAAMVLGCWIAGSAAWGGPTQWTALYNRGQPLATYAVGDRLDYPYEFAINTDTTGWVVEYGVGQNADGSDWTWHPADWSRMDGSDNRVWISKSLEQQFTSAGTWYYAGRFVNGGDTYYAATDWTANSGEPLAAESYFTVNELEPPGLATAVPDTTHPATRADLSWMAMNGKNVLITRASDPWPEGSPEQGTTYSAGQTFGNQTVISGSQSGSELEVPGLEPFQRYCFFFYTENNSYYSAGTMAEVFTAKPQARNTSGGSPEAPAEIFLGDAGLPFGFDSWGTIEANWGRATFFASPDDQSSYGFISGTDYTDAEHKTLSSGVFSSTGTWHWGVQMDYGFPYGDQFWYKTGSTEWANMESWEYYNYFPGDLTVNVQPINDPMVQSPFVDSGSQIWLSWDGNAQNHGVLIVRKLATDSWTEPTQGQFNWYNVGDSLGAGTVVYFDPLGSWGMGSTMATGLTAGTTYDFKFYSVNASSTFVIPAPYEGVGFYYSPGVEAQATTVAEGPIINGCDNRQVATPDGSMVAVTYAITVVDITDPDPTVLVDPPSGSLFPMGDTLVTVTAWNASGHTNTCEFTVTVVPDTVAPVIGGCGNRVVAAYDPAGVTATYSWLTISDNADPNSTVVYDPPIGSLLPLGEIPVTVTAWDLAGNTNTCQFTATVALQNIAAWGLNRMGLCNVPASLTNVVAIAAGAYHSFALKSAGTITTWGADDNGQCSVPAGLTDVTAIAAGANHSLALKSDGTVLAWGENGKGQCSVPGELTDVVAIAGGYDHSIALRSDGMVVVWGGTNYFQSDVPEGLMGVTGIAAGANHSLALKSDGTVVAWGWNLFGQCNVPAGLTNVVAISAGLYHNLALKSDGTVAAWGRGLYGSCSVPKGLSNVVMVAAGANHSLALRSDGSVVAWGDNRDGQSAIPEGLTNGVAIAGGHSHSLALVETRDVSDDTTAPVIYGCTNRTVPLGKPALYMVRVFDDIDPRPTVTYDPPLGTVLPGGDTVVTVTAWDAAGNTNTCQFTVTVPVPSPVVSQDAVNVREGGEGRFFVRLDRAPEGFVTVNVARDSGDEGISIQSGATRTFKPSNWNTWQAVNLAAAADADADGETAVFRVSLAGQADQFVTATALDDEIGNNLALASAGSTIAGSSRPADLIDGVHAVSANYGYATWTNAVPGKMVLDLKQATRISRIRLLNWDWVYRVHRYTIESSLDGANWSSLVDATGEEHQGWDDWTLADRSARYLRLVGVSNSANAYVCFSELEVYGAACPLPRLEVSSASVNVREGGEGRFFVRLASAPTGNVAVAVARSAGDASLTIQQGAARSYTPLNWNQWQAVTLAQAADENAAGETASFQVSATGYEATYVDAAALDDDVAENLAPTARVTAWKAYQPTHLNDGIHASSGNYGYTAWTNVPAGRLTMDLGAQMTVSRIRLLNWDWVYRVHRYRIEASADGASWSTLIDATGAEHQGWDDWAVANESIRYLRFVGTSNSANAYVCLSELEVYGTRPGRRAFGTAGAVESEPISVLTSAGAEDASGWNAVDGDAATAWTAPANAGYLVVEYGPTLDLRGLEIELAEGSPANVEVRTSLDAAEWQPLPEDLEKTPVSLNFLWLVFPGDGTEALPSVVDIWPNP